MKLLLTLVLLLLPFQAWATNRTVTNNATFNTALSLTVPGDTITLQNGIYTPISINCNSGAANGTGPAANQVITIKAANERQALIQGDGSVDAFHMTNCAYWIIQGLYFRTADNASGSQDGDAFYVDNSSNITFTRNISYKNNRQKNSAPNVFYQVSNLTVTENEVYYGSIQGFLFSQVTNAYFARNYGNKRGDSSVGAYGQGFSSPLLDCYPCSNTIIANNIAEGYVNNGGVGEGISIQSAGPGASNNKVLGNVVIGGNYGIVLNARDSDGNPTNMTMVDNVIVNPISYGIYARSPYNVSCTNCSVFATSTTLAGFAADKYESVDVSPFSIFATNSFVINASTGYGFNVDTSSGGWSGTLDHNLANGNSTNFSVSAPVTNTSSSTASPGNIGTCTIWVPPTASGLKGKGANGNDIGANALYQYDTFGARTATSLWATSGGFLGAWLPRGATVAGLNDHNGDSAFDVHTRLGNATCAAPAAGTPPTIAITNPAPPFFSTNQSTITISGTSSLQ